MTTRLSNKSMTSWKRTNHVHKSHVSTALKQSVINYWGLKSVLRATLALSSIHSNDHEFLANRTDQNHTAPAVWSSSLVRVYTVYHSVYMFWTHDSTIIKPHHSNFRITIAIVSEVPIIRISRMGPDMKQRWGLDRKTKHCNSTKTSFLFPKRNDQNAKTNGETRTKSMRRLKH